MSGLQRIVKKRKRQLRVHGRSIKLDILYNDNGELLKAAKAMMAKDKKVVFNMLPEKWDATSKQNLSFKPYTERLVLAGAFIAAEIDRLESISKTSS